MMNTPSMYSVDQLLKARQNGVPDYVVVPMLQKAMAQKQAMAQQQALQQGAPKPPVAQQILDAAHNDVMQEHMARQVEEAPEPRGIDSLPSGIDESDYAGGGIIAFAQGGDTPYQVDEADYAPAYTGADLDPMAQRDIYLKSMGSDPGIAKQEERIASREASLKGEEDKAPWMALMQAGLSTMAGTSPNAFANIGEGASKGLTSYGESKKGLAARADKLDELRGRMEDAQRAEKLAATTFGFNSVEHKQAANEKRALEKQAAKVAAGLGADKYYMNREDNAAAMQRSQLAAGSSAASTAETSRHNRAMEAAGNDGLTAAQARLLKSNDTDIKTVKELIESASKPGEAEFYTEKLKGLLVRRQEIEGGGEPIKLYTPPAQPVKGPDFMDRVLHPIDAWNGNLPGQNPETSSTIKLPSGATAKRVG
jgi:hypothetical protein